MIRQALSTQLKTVSYQKVLIEYPKVKPPPPVQADYDLLGVTPEDDNRKVIDKFREEVMKVHPTVTSSPAALLRHSQLEAAYNRIALHRMAEQGVPQPFTVVHSYAHPYTKMIKEFRKLHAVEENAFFTPHVPTHYVSFLFAFWVVFGSLYTLNDWYDPLRFKEALAYSEANA